MIAGEISGVLSIATSKFLETVAWGKVGDWIVEAGGKLPKAVKELPVLFQMFVRWLMARLHKLWKAFINLAKHLADLLDLSGDDEDESFVKKCVDWVIELIQSSVTTIIAREVWDVDELEKDASKWVNKAAKKVGGKKHPLSEAQQDCLSGLLTNIKKDTLTKVKIQATVIGYVAQGAGIVIGLPVTVGAVPIAVGLGSIIGVSVIVLMTMGADALRDEPWEGFLHPGIAPLTEEKLKSLLCGGWLEI
jgi:hypothetical protein